MTGPGVKGFLKKMTDVRRERSWAEAAAQLAEKELRKPFRDVAGADPGLKTLKHVYLNGGVVWVAANVMQPANRGAKVPLTVQDLRDFAKRIGDNPRFLKDFAPPADMPASDREALEVELLDMRKKMAPEYLIAGAQILLALADELELDDKGKELVFYRHSDFAWTLAYVIETAHKGR
jgi:hypothetical protein